MTYIELLVKCSHVVEIERTQLMRNEIYLVPFTSQIIVCV